MRARQFWLYKNREKGQSCGHAGSWERFFRSKAARIWSDATMRIVDFDTKACPIPGDLVFAQQSDTPRSLVGVGEVVEFQNNPLVLTLRPALRFPKPVPLAYRPRLLKFAPDVAKIQAMGTDMGSMFFLRKDEACALARFCGSNAVSLIEATGNRAREELISEAGAGFGDSAENHRTELAAIQATILHLQHEGWKYVADVQKECLGYDLVFRKSGVSIHVEVKGVRGSTVSFFLTANEERCMRADPAWRLCVVTLATTLSPVVQVFDSREASRRFSFKPALFKLAERRGS